MGTKKQCLMQFFDDCIKENRFESITIGVKMPDLPELEQIINPRANWESKKAYYERAYNDDLKLNANPIIEIVTWFGN